MRLSTKGRYGLKAMFELALHFGEGPIPLKDVAEIQNISEHYLEQLVATLRRAGYVNSVRGAQGGYFLSKEPKDITVGDVIRCLEGQIAPVECVMEDAADCKRDDYCVTKTIWKNIRDSVNEVIDNTTLQDMVDDHIKNH